MIYYHDARPFLWAMFGMGFGIFVFFRGFSMLRYKRLILNTPASKIRSAAMGLVELTGMTTGPHTVPAGVTGEACYFYRATAWELRQSGNSRQWKQVANESACVPFFLEDSTGKIPVNVQGADLDLHCNFRDELGSSFFSSREMLSPNVALFLARNNVNMSRKIRLEEYCVKPGFPLWVMGTLGENSRPLDWTPVKQVPRSTVMGGSATTPHSKLNFAGMFGGSWTASLTQKFTAGTRAGDVTAVPDVATATGMANSGRQNETRGMPKAVWSSVSADEIEMGRSRGANSVIAANTIRSENIAARSVAIAERKAGQDSAEPEQPPHPVEPSHEDFPAALVSQGNGSAPFIISWRSQKEVVKSLAWKSVLCIWGGPALTLASFYMLARIFNWI